MNYVLEDLGIDIDEYSWEAEPSNIESIKHFRAILAFNGYHDIRVFSKDGTYQDVFTTYDLKIDGRDQVIKIRTNKIIGTLDKYDFVIDYRVDTSHMFINDMYLDKEHRYIVTPRDELHQCVSGEIIDMGDILYVTNFIKSDISYANHTHIECTNMLGNSVILSQSDLIQYWEVTKYNIKEAN